MKTFLLFVSAALVAAQTADSNTAAPAVVTPPVASDKVEFHRRLEVAKQLEAATLKTGSLVSKGNVQTAGGVEAKTFTSMSLEAQALVTPVIRSETGTININGNLVLASTKPAVAATSFITESINIRGVQQWVLVHHDDFESKTTGWNEGTTNTCDGSANRHLGGHCAIADGQLTKIFEMLPAHKEVRITARFHFIDNWQGETGYVKVAGKTVWTETPVTGSRYEGFNICGSPDFPEKLFGQHVDIVRAHNEASLEVSFGSSGISMLLQDPCARSFGIDDVMVYVR